MVLRKRSRAHDTHIAPDDVPELGQFVEARAAEEATDPRQNARVLLKLEEAHPFRLLLGALPQLLSKPLLGIAIHAADFVAWDRPSAPYCTLLSVKYRPGINPPNGCYHQREDRKGQDGRRHGDGEIKGSLHEGTHRRLTISLEASIAEPVQRRLSQDEVVQRRLLAAGDNADSLALKFEDAGKRSVARQAEHQRLTPSRRQTRDLDALWHGCRGHYVGNRKLVGQHAHDAKAKRWVPDKHIADARAICPRAHNEGRRCPQAAACQNAADVALGEMPQHQQDHGASRRVEHVDSEPFGDETHRDFHCGAPGNGEAAGTDALDRAWSPASIDAGRV